jgi:hypothetical protein
MTAINTTTYEGLDYDPRRGYEPDNVRLVCALANFAMNAWGLEPLSRWRGPWPRNMPRRLGSRRSALAGPADAKSLRQNGRPPTLLGSPDTGPAPDCGSQAGANAATGRLACCCSQGGRD